MKKFFLTLLLACVFCGCTANIENNPEGDKMSVTESVLNEPNDDQIANFLKLMKDDKIGDGSTVRWDNGIALSAEDELDSIEMNDGYVGVTESKIYKSDLCISCVYPSEFTLEPVDESVPGKLHLINEKNNEEIFVEQINYYETIERLDNDSNYLEINQFMLSEHQTKYFKDYKLYTGIKEFDAVKKAGFVLVFDSDLDDRAYIIEVYGQGSMNLLWIKACFVMNRFDVLFY